MGPNLSQTVKTNLEFVSGSFFFLIQRFITRGAEADRIRKRYNKLMNLK